MGRGRKPRGVRDVLVGFGHRRTVAPHGTVASTCWCELEFVAVTPAEVFNGITKSCGRPSCVPPSAMMRA